MEMELRQTRSSAESAPRLNRGASSLHPIEREIIVRAEGLKKVFRSGESDIVVFENLSFQVAKGEMLAIVGESGAGRSTLLDMLGALYTASSGDGYGVGIRWR